MSAADSYFLTLERRYRRLGEFFDRIDQKYEETDRYARLGDMSSKTFDTICERPAQGPEGMAVKLRFLQEQGQYFAHGEWDRTLLRTLQDTVERMASA